MSVSSAAASTGLSSDSRSYASRDSESALVYCRSSGTIEGMTAWNVGVKVADADCRTKIST